MRKEFSQGDTLANRYQLKQQISSDHLTDQWAAYDEQLGETIHLVIFQQPLTATRQQTLRSILAQQKGLLHSNISRIYTFEETSGRAFYTSQTSPHATPHAIKQAHSFRHEGSFQQQWQILRQVIDILAYAHSLGFYHGLLSADNLLICDSNVHLLNMGFAPFVGDTTSAYASPELALGNAPTQADDMYSLGQLLHKALTGKYHHASDPLGIQLPPVIGPLLLNMLQVEAHKRPTDLNKLKRAIDDYVTGNHRTLYVTDNPLEPRNKLQTPASQTPVTPAHKLPRDRTTISSRWVLWGAFFLLCLGLGVFFLLPFLLPHGEPRLTDENIKAGSQVSLVSAKVPGEPTGTPLAPLAAAKLKRLQADGKTAVDQLFRLQIKLEDKGGTVWAAPQYKQAVATGFKGDDAYADEQYQTALELYREAIAILQQTLDQVDVVFDKNLAVGTAALKRGHGPQAIEAFTILNTIRPADPDIKNSLIRAENLDAVQHLMQRGSVHEREGELKLALASYQSALSLDHQWPSAKQGVDRIKQLLADRQFNEQMSKGFRALNNHNYAEARAFFNSSQRLRPASSAPKDGLDQLFVFQNNAAIEGYRTAAKKHMALEQWQSAIDKYESILTIASGSQFAHEEKSQAILRLTLNNKLDRFINKPTLMMLDSELRQAKKILLQANSIPSKGPNLKKQINQLSHSVSQARVLVPVTLISNNKTLVTIYKVAAFGKFAHKSVNLIPGVYTIVGKRKGYRDVSFELVLKGGEPARSFTISCIEQI